MPLVFANVHLLMPVGIGSLQYSMFTSFRYVYGFSIVASKTTVRERNRMMRKPMAVIMVVLLAAGLAGCQTEETGYYDDFIETGTVCVHGYLYAYSYLSGYPEGYDMEPMGQVCGTE